MKNNNSEYCVEIIKKHMLKINISNESSTVGYEEKDFSNEYICYNMDEYKIINEKNDNVVCAMINIDYNDSVHVSYIYDEEQNVYAFVFSYSDYNYCILSKKSFETTITYQESVWYCDGRYKDKTISLDYGERDLEIEFFQISS